MEIFERGPGSDTNSVNDRKVSEFDHLVPNHEEPFRNRYLIAPPYRVSELVEIESESLDMAEVPCRRYSS